MLSLALTDKQILQQIPPSYLHRYDIATMFLITLIAAGVLLLISLYISDGHFNKKVIRTAKVCFRLAIPICFLSAGAGIFSAYVGDTQNRLNSQQVKLLLQAHTTVDDRDTVELVGASSAGYNKADISGGLFYVSGSTMDTSTFRYVVQTNGLYQVKTLSDTYEDVNSNDVYINQSNKVKPSLVVEKKHYTNPKIAKLVKSLSDHSSSWTTYTFNVPENSVAKSFDFK